MNETYHFADFGDLYRAAFAEPNPAIKQLLLAEVKKALDHWAETINEGKPASARPACTPVDSSRIVPFRPAA
jgi:hypothetical protein